MAGKGIDLRPGRAPMTRNLLVGSLLLLLLLVLSVPMILLLSGGLSESALHRLSDTGQAYGVVAALFSVLAFLAVAVSVGVQVDQRREGSTLAWRSAHAEILRMAMDEPDVFGPCLGALDAELGETRYRQFLFSTLYLHYLRSTMDPAQMTPAWRSEIFGSMFRSPVARELWLVRRKIIVTAYGDLDGFLRMVDEEYHRALENDREGDPGSPTGPRSDEIRAGSAAGPDET